jgi:dTDP-4-dehydrorhamnose 3,5-epimerase-like enzyme
VLDVVVDVRPESPTFNRPYAVELSHASHQALMIGKGYAHGFLALDDDSSMLYATTTVHEPSLDSGVLWSSINFQWPIQSPILSARDQLHDPICI